MFKVNFNVKGKKFAAEFKTEPSKAELKSEVLKQFPGEDVIAHFGRVAFCNGNKGCYVNNGTYTVEEV